MNIGIDFHDTLTYCPDFFRFLIKSWNLGDTYIITGTPASQRKEVEYKLKEFNCTGHKDILMGYEYKKNQMTVDHFKRMQVHKYNLLKSYQIKIYFDDNPFYANYMKDKGIFVFETIVNSEYLNKFKKVDPFFTCHLQEKQFDFLNTLLDIDVLK